jgi:hypothetical protein
MRAIRTTLGLLATDLPNGPTPTLVELTTNRGNDGKPLETCDHDWRVDNTLILESEPPQHYVLCARCAAYSSQVIPSELWEGYLAEWRAQG